MRTTIKADFLSLKSFLPKTIVNKGITRDFRSLFVTYTQFCVAHVKRQILNSVSHKDKPIVNQELNEVFTLENKEHKSLQGYEHFITFVNRWEKKYPVLRKYKAQRNIAYFTYMDFPVEV